MSNRCRAALRVQRDGAIACGRKGGIVNIDGGVSGGDPHCIAVFTLGRVAAPFNSYFCRLVGIHCITAIAGCCGNRIGQRYFTRHDVDGVGTFGGDGSIADLRHRGALRGGPGTVQHQPLSVILSSDGNIGKHG